MEKTPEVYVRDLLLKHKKSNPICSQHIADLLNLNYERQRPYSPTDVRKIINQLRTQEIPIIANSKGYFVSYNIEDIIYQIESFESRMKSMKSAQSGLRGVFNTIIKSNNGRV